MISLSLLVTSYKQVLDINNITLRKIGYKLDYVMIIKTISEFSG